MDMKKFVRFFIGLFIMVSGSISVKAQDVIINIPAANIFDRTELSTVKTVMQAKRTVWNGFIGLINPTFRSLTGENFSTSSGILLPTSILLWRLESIGGQTPLYGLLDVWPDYKWFTNNNQSWYQPAALSNYRKGDVKFTFKISSNVFQNNAYHFGEYSIQVTHNYDTSYFTPATFYTILNIPAAISWRTNNPTKYIEISSLNPYRLTSAHILGDLGAAELGSTVDFNLQAKASSANITFTSSKNVQGIRNVSTILLGSTGTGTVLTKKALSPNWQNYSTSSFIVKTGNRNNFTLQFSTSAADFKTHFFEAGTYTFQLNLDAKSSSGTFIPAISSLQNTDVTIKVLPLSEITIPTSGQTVNFNFNTSAHYSDGQSKVITNQIKLSNNETFELYVKSASPKFNKGGVQTDINSDILQIGVDGSSLNVPLSTTPQKIVAGGNPVLDRELNIKYTIPPAGAQILVGKEKTTYSINVIYSFTAL